MTEAELQQAFADNRAQAKHLWRQQGARLFCIGCPMQHATEPVFTGYILTGTDKNGLPILTKV